MKPIMFLHWPTWTDIPVPLPKAALDALAQILALRPLDNLVDLETGRDGESLGFQQHAEFYDLCYYHEPCSDLGEEGTQGIYWSGGCMSEVGCTAIQEAASLIIQRHQAPALFPEAI